MVHPFRNYLMGADAIRNSHMCQRTELCHKRSSVRMRGVRCSMKRIGSASRTLSVLLFALLVFQGCNTLNPLCGSARPTPIIASLSPSTVTLAEVQQGFLLTVNGSQFVSSSVVEINGTKLATLATSSQQLQATVTSAVIAAAGTASVTVNTPSGNSGDLGCTSGGTSQPLVLTIT
jgi:DhnA family fructose-bisphosphate aldolase class Ia